MRLSDVDVDVDVNTRKKQKQELRLSLAELVCAVWVSGSVMSAGGKLARLPVTARHALRAAQLERR